MSLSLNPADVWKIFSEGKRRNKEEVATWLDAVAADARKLADVWADVVQAISTKQPLSVDEVIELQLRIGGPNAAPFRRLTHFYETASNVIGGRVKDETRTDFSRSVGSLLVNRERAMRFCRTIYSTLGNMNFLVDNANSTKGLDDFYNIVNVLNREAAALEVLAKNFRASG
jgi:hypothetical protein